MKLITYSRLSLLMLLIGGTVVVLGNGLLGNVPSNVPQTPVSISFPFQVPLVGWSLQNSQPLAESKLKDGGVIAGWRYRYEYSKRPLTVEMRYFKVPVNPGKDPRLPLYQLAQLPNQLFQKPSMLRQQSEIGYYSLGIYQRKAYFNAYIDPNSYTTNTINQCEQRNFNDIHFNRLIPWLLGQKNHIRDKYCVWVLLSLPLDQTETEDIFKDLEKSGINWVKWWETNFPKS